MSVAKNSFIFSAGTLLSRVSGVLRESVIGGVFGASVFVDAYNVAFRIPNLLRELLAEGALGSSFTKVYSEVAVDDLRRAQELLVQTLQFVVLISLCVSALGMYFAEPIVRLVSSSAVTGEGSVFFLSTVGLTQVLFPFIGFVAVGAIAQGVLYQRGGFFLAAVAPIAFNVLCIVGSFRFGSVLEAVLPDIPISHFGNYGILGLAAGTLIGGALQSLIQLWGIWSGRLSFKSLCTLKLKVSPDLRRVFVLMVPMVIAASAGQINVIVNTNFATSLGEGATTWLSFAFRLMQLPIGLFGVAVSAAVLPAMAKSIALAGGKVGPATSKEIIGALELVCWLLVPCTILLTQSSLPLTSFLFQAGRFTQEDTSATALAMAAYGWGLLGYGILKVMNSYYYAVNRTRFPMFVGLVSIAVNFILNSLLVKQWGHSGLAMTASAVLTINAIILLFGMTKDGVQVDWRYLGRSFVFLVGATLICELIYKVLRPNVVDFIPQVQWPLLQGVWAQKAQSFSLLTFDLFCIGLVFIGAMTLKFGRSPLKILKRN
jgi:putative peptidoglycan lipid II flippase